MRFLSIAGAVSILFLSLGSVADGQEVTSPDSALAAILHSIQGTSLPLQRAVDSALTNAIALRRARAVYLAARGTERKASGGFDPELFFSVSYLDQNQPTASFFSGAPTLATQTTSSRAGIRLDLPIGTQLQLSMNATRLNSNSSLAFLNPEYDAFGSLSLRQPLLRGFSASARKYLTQSERGAEAEKARLDQQTLAVSATVERAYWDLYAAVRNLAVQQLTRDRAEAFLNEAEVRATTGLVGPNQVASARTFLAQQELQLLDRSEELDRQSDQLASLIGVRPEAGTIRFIPSDRPPGDFQADSIEQIVASALRANLELQAAQKDVEAARALSNAASWEALPSLDVFGSIGGNGLGGQGQQVIIFNDSLPVPRSRSFGDALTQVTKRQFPNWSVGVEVSIPIGFRGGLGERDRLQAQTYAAEQNYIDRARALEEQVRSTCRELAHGRARLDAAKTGVDAAYEQVRIGLIEFHNGRSTAFELVRLGEDFAVAQQRYSEALVRTAKAAATLRQLTSGAYPSAKR